MIRVEVYEDIQGFEAKLFGPFTLRQSIFIIAGAIPAVITYFVLRANNFVLPFSLLVAIMVFTPIAALGVIKVYGFPITKFITTFIKYMVLAPRYRIYKQNNALEAALKKLEADRKKDPDYVKELKQKEKAMIRARQALLRGKEKEYIPLP